ncbi:sulfatase-like hydrolase/transferase [Pontiella sulfatireligans]|uniref:Arylsulfatase n=1 Tax=Pontiella sulfatireligans TaxID=2750658 RepID=A0A6C2UFV2_9BACT|nr:sulfatase-like hydrolase/transferase [Pontiella sulfatireligans]SPS74286.1 sulfatase S1_44 [Kiritimatiellales bacterium]VGO19092.1 Arylsulfatase [Pontiella sulfatireligans]
MILKKTTAILLMIGAGICFADKPNIVVILTDDQGYGQTPLFSPELYEKPFARQQNTARYECPPGAAEQAAKISMPHLQRLAADGVRFTNAHVASPICGPSRAAIMTARYPQRFGIYWNDDMHKGVPLDEVFIPELFQQSGYRTAVIGKWHVGALVKEKIMSATSRDYHDQRIDQCVAGYHPYDRGFDYFFGYYGAGASLYDSPSLFRGKDLAEAKGCLVDQLTEEALSFARTGREAPFLLYLAYNVPHIPLEARMPEKYLKRFNTGNAEVDNYYASLAAVDDGIGRLVGTLEKQGRLDNTLIVFMSDNGAVVDSPQPLNGRFRGYKSLCSAGGTQIPMVMCWKNKLEGGTVFDGLASSMDAFATALDIANIPIPTTLQLDGKSLIPILTKQTEQLPHEVLFWAGPDSPYWGDSNTNFWTGYWNYITSKQDEMPVSGRNTDGSWTVRKGPWSLQYTHRDTRLALYHMETDPGESMDVSRAHPETVQELKLAVKKWYTPMKEPLSSVSWNTNQWEKLRDSM